MWVTSTTGAKHGFDFVCTMADSGKLYKSKDTRVKRALHEGAFQRKLSCTP